MKKRILVLSMVLALVAAMVMPMAALAGNPATGETVVSGTLTYNYTLTPPEAITLGPFIEATPYESANKTVSVSTNDGTITMCGITVKDAKTNTTGYLTLGGVDETAKKLTNALEVKGGALTYSPLTSEKTLRVSTTSPVSAANMTDFAVKQTIASGDLTKTAGTYSLTMTFTATFS